MFWILRRTRLTSAALLNVINNNSESRPARKDYNKLAGEEISVASSKEEQLDNESVCRKNCAQNEHHDTDTDSSFTDFEIDERDDFSDDSDYANVAMLREKYRNACYDARRMCKCNSRTLQLTG
ncbi:uncharacterized protein LOC116180087 [Photinus pyralis]|uniref:uncharacterized protein LOC116180087 n=1 Tax=Photinus pyralis TaxID=7054 RepID=UPI0012671D05|nr:uncharacterized protein LOC116180087 [Photinus pyralis]